MTVAARLWICAVLATGARGDQIVYDDALADGWDNWSWASVDFAASSTTHGGSNSISVTVGAWQALYLHHSAFDATPYTNLSFWIHGGPIGGQSLQVQATLSGSAQPPVTLDPLPANTWQAVTLPLASLGVASALDFDGFWIQDRAGASQPVFYVDDIRLIAGPATPPATNSPVAVLVDAALNRRPIRPEIYGVAFASEEDLLALNVPVNRSGGNATSRYNWQLNATSRAADWYFESLPSSDPTPGADGDAFILESRQGGAEPMLTIPINGWVAKLGPNRQRLASFSIAKYGPQTDRDAQWFPDAGNGIAQATGLPITSNDPTDANQPADPAFQADWVRHLTNRWGTAGSGGLRYYLLDNEWSLWHETHRDVHPVGATMDQMRDAAVAYATIIKEIDPDALVLGPEEWGWSGYFYSGYDLQWGSQHGWSSLPDRTAHDGADFLPWFLDQLRQQSATAGRRLLDVCTIHYYPQSGEFSGGTDTAMQLRRNRSTRSLWDPNYTDESWINDRVRLIPRLREWVNESYPGTAVGITEYSWGSENHINGATTQADLLGIFGREGLDLATRWVVPGASTPTFKAFQMYRNYDGNRSTFGETNVAASGPNPDNLAVFAALRARDGALTIMVINKQLNTAAPISLRLTNFVAGTSAQPWQLTSANSIQRLADVAVTANTLSTSLPAQSITLIVVPPGLIPPRLRLANLAQSGQVELQLESQPGHPYILESSTNFVEWTPVRTNTATADSIHFTLPHRSITAEFYRARVGLP